jgi:hypothetical protein
MVNAQISVIRKLLGPGEELQNVQNVFCIEWHQFTTNSKLEIAFVATKVAITL